jgi:hypothetical protein
MTTVIEKLTPSWKEFKNYLKHKRKEMRVEDLILRLKIREDTSYQKKRVNSSSSFKANIVAQVPKSYN